MSTTTEKSVSRVLTELIEEAVDSSIDDTVSRDVLATQLLDALDEDQREEMAIFGARQYVDAKLRSRRATMNAENVSYQLVPPASGSNLRLARTLLSMTVIELRDKARDYEDRAIANRRQARKFNKAADLCEEHGVNCLADVPNGEALLAELMNPTGKAESDE